MERDEEIISENGDPMMRSSAQLQHPSEVLLTILAGDNNTEIITNSDNVGSNPNEVLLSMPAIDSNTEIAADSDNVDNNFSEDLLSIQAIGSNIEIATDSYNPGNLSYSMPSRGNHRPLRSFHSSHAHSRSFSTPSAPRSFQHGETNASYRTSTSYRKRIIKKKSSSSSGSFLRKRINSIYETKYSEDWGATYTSHEFSNQFNMGPNDRNNNRSESNCSYPRPEKQLIDFCLRLVILDKTLSGIRMLAFIWATVVLLGGFASTLKKIDFWFVATIIFIIGTGIFSRNHQLESRFFFQAAKAISSKVGMIITFLQFLFASVSITVSMMRLVEQGYSEYKGQTNMKAALNIFYAVALTHALLFLLENAYWFWTVSHLKIIEKVREECGFGTSGVTSLRRFFYETYWQLTKGSVFHALDLDLITFAQGLLIINSQGDQLIAVRILNGLISHDQCSPETCRRISTSTETINRLVNMLSWHDQGEQAIRIFAAQIVANLASKIRVESFPDAMDCISSLLKQEDGSKLNLLGLLILKNLASIPLNCLKITERTDLISKIVDFTRFNAQIIEVEERSRMVKRSLKLLKKIVSTKGKVGQTIRQDISQIASIVSNLRDILISDGIETVLSKLTIKILIALSMDKAAQNKIGSTDGIIRLLLYTFLESPNSMFGSTAGEALVMLTVQSKRICCKILQENADVIQQLVSFLYKEVHPYIVMKTLTNICAYSGTKWQDKLRQVITALPWVLKNIMSHRTVEKVLEASIGLCVQISKLTGIEEFTQVHISEANFSMIDVAERLRGILEDNIYTDAKIPCLRRNVIELIIWIMESNDPLIQYFKEAGMKKILAQTAETTAEFENFYYFSGNFGVMKHPKTISSLVLKAKALLA